MKVEAVYDSTISDILGQRIVGVELGNDCTREYAKWVRDKVVAEPCKSWLSVRITA
jgi:hypothetical protein